MLRHMLPLASLDNSSDGCRGDTIPVGYLDLWNSGFCKLADFSNVTGSQFRIRMMFSSRQRFWVRLASMVTTTRDTMRVSLRSVTSSSCSTSFAFHVKRILSRCSKEEMIWSNASWVVATMKYPQFANNRAVRQFESNPLGIGGLAIDPELSVPVNGTTSGPFPASFAAIHLRPESLVHRLNLSCIRTLTRTIRANLAYISCKDDVAERANHGVLGTLGAHWKLLTSDAMLRDVRASPGLSCAPNYTELGRTNA